MSSQDNNCWELNTVAAAELAYDYDDIGNRETSSERGTNTLYAANNLNQYTSITNISTSQLSNIPTFQPVFDVDGNQTLIKTATGTWQVTYNGENRPVRWERVSSGSNTLNPNTQTLLLMSYDRMGRRVTKNDQRFVYDGYLQIADNAGNTYVWDVAEPVATRPLVWNFSTSQPSTSQLLFYTHDGNKNVSEVVAANGEVSAHYEHAPFGALVAQCGGDGLENPWRFSSEYADDPMGLVYYNYRHYEPTMGRWMQRDPIAEAGGVGLYVYVENQIRLALDWLGLAKLSLEYETSEDGKKTMSEIMDELRKKFEKYSPDGNDPCNCLSHLRLIGHGVDGSVSLGDYDITQFWIDSYRKRKGDGSEPSKNEPTEALDMLSLAASFACKEFTIEFVTCCSGKGEAGGYLRQSLQELLGKNANIVLYEREVGMCLGFVIEKPYWISWWESFIAKKIEEMKQTKEESK